MDERLGEGGEKNFRGLSGPLEVEGVGANIDSSGPGHGSLGGDIHLRKKSRLEPGRKYTLSDPRG